MNYSFESGLRELIEEYIGFKTAMGYSKATYDRVLHQLDVFCVQNYPEETSLTREIVEEWSRLREGIEGINGLKRRLICLNGFTDYLLLTGRHAYKLPEGSVGSYESFRPYIYTDKEILDFFYAADNFPMGRCLGNQQVILPVLFRMMFCCGLRPQEVPNIKRCHIDAEKRTLYIEDSKNHKDRLLVMSEELSNLCALYEERIRLPGREYFFQLPQGEKLSITWMQLQFRKCWKAAGYTFPKEHHPRNFDWRHNFATRVLMKWFENGEDVYANLPCLSTYMGHSKLEHTLYYIHILPERLTSSGKMDWGCIPEVPEYEE